MDAQYFHVKSLSLVTKRLHSWFCVKENVLLGDKSSIILKTFSWLAGLIHSNVYFEARDILCFAPKSTTV